MGLDGDRGHGGVRVGQIAIESEQRVTWLLIAVAAFFLAPIAVMLFLALVIVAFDVWKEFWRPLLRGQFPWDTK